MNLKHKMNRMIRPFSRIFILTILFTIGFYGCGKDDKGGTPPPSAGLNKGRLYVANAGGGGLLAFDSAATAEGNLFPSSRFPETVSGPAGLYLDRTTDTLYVANAGSNAILIYENVSALNPPLGSAVASKIISGPKTELNRPYGITYDPTRGLLYVANRDGNAISVFGKNCPQPNSLSGNIPPCRTLSGPSTSLNAPRALAIDTENDILYVSNMGTNAVLAYHNASQPSTQGDFPPTRTIGSIPSPFGLFIDSANDRLYVVRGGTEPAVLIYENASQRSGEAAPDRVVSGTGTQPAGIDVDAARGELFVVDSAALLVFNLNSADLAPNRTLSGSKVGLSNPVGIAVDPDRGMSYVSNAGANEIRGFLSVLDGNFPPIQTNPGDAALRLPASFFYDKASDRLYVANAGRDSCAPSSPCITVYKNISNRTFDNTDPRGTAPDWTLSDSNIQNPRGIYLDKTRNRLIVMSASNRRLLIYDSTLFPPNPSPGQNVPLTPLTNFDLGLIPNTPLSAMTVDEGKGAVYIAWSGAGTSIDTPIKVYNLTAGAITRTLSGSATRLNQPVGTHFGLFIDPAKDILYVTNAGDNTVLSFDSNNIDGNIAPTRILSSPAGTAPEERFDKPIAPFVDTAANRLYLINQGKNGIFVFNNASTRSGAVLPDRMLVGGNTLLNACITTSTTYSFTGALFVDAGQGKEALYVGQPRTIGQGCSLFVPPSDGSLLIFRNEGNIPPGKIFSGGEASLPGPSAIAVDTSKDHLFVANEGDPTATSDDSLSIFPKVSQGIGSLLLTGTVSVSQSSPIVTGEGTTFKTDLREGDLLTIGGERATVSAIFSDTSFTLTSLYPGQDASGITLSKPVRSSCSPAAAPPCPDTKFNNPAGLAVDPVQNRLYVSNSGTACSAPETNPDPTPCNTILVFSAADRLNNNAKPDRILLGPSLNGPRGLALDLDRKTLYVANSGGNSILAFDLAGVEGQSGTLSLTPKVEIGGLNRPVGVALDPANDLLYVLNQGTLEILVFDRVSTLGGSVSPSPARVISGKGFMAQPSSLFLDPGNDLLYVADQGANAVYIYPQASIAQGEAGHKTLAGDDTGLNAPSAIFIDMTR